MIAKHVPMKVAKKSGFANLLAYLADAQAKRERVGCVTVTNCQSDQAVVAITEILNTQAQNQRALSDKTYHLILSFPAGEEPAPAVLQAVEARICQGLGYGAHQRISVVRELFGVMAARGAAGGFVVTSGSFTAEAKAFVDGRNETLVDGPALARRIREVGARTPESTTGMARVKTTPTAEPTQDTRATMSTAKATATATATATTTTTTTMAAPHERPAAMATTTAAETPPTCPTCQSAMVRRMARTGPRAGASFWGCSRFPSCRGTR